MTDNARIVREALDCYRHNCEVPHCGAIEEGGGGLCPSCEKHGPAMEAITALETELSAARKALEEALPLETFWLDYERAKAVANRKPISSALNGDSHAD